MSVPAAYATPLPPWPGAGRAVQIVTVRLRHPCPYSGPLREMDGARATHLCHRGHAAILELNAQHPADVGPLERTYVRLGGEPLYEDGAAALVRFPSCACCRSGRVIPSFERAGHLNLPPVRYAPDGETYQFLAPRAEGTASLPAGLGAAVTVDHLATHPLTSLGFEDGFLVPAGTLARELTDRQRGAMVAAILRGYYRSPRAVAAQELAGGFGISRAAFDALLRKAENKLATALFPYLAVAGSGSAGAPARAGRPRPPGRRPGARRRRAGPP